MARSRSERLFGRRARTRAAVWGGRIGAAALLLHCLFAGPAIGSDAAAPAAQTLHLEVVINGRPANLIAQFSRGAKGRFSATARELKEIGIRPPAGAFDDADIVLDEIDGLGYRYDEVRQIIALSVGDELRQIREIGPPDSDTGPPDIDTSLGAVLNYALVGTITDGGGDGLDGRRQRHSSASGQFDGRLFGPYGTVTSSAIAASNLRGSAQLVRLDSAWSYSDPHKMQVWRAGDVISGGHSWTRPLRIAGVQVQRSFALRPDLITMALPSVSGTAAVPSTVDVYINNVKALSRDIEPGPFSVSNLPVAAGGGLTRVVLRDALGRQSESLTPFFASPKLLRPGLFDFSLEAGFARRSYGLRSADYDGSIVASGSIKYGLDEAVTLEGHGEAGAGVANGGAGATFKVGQRAIMSVAASASHFGGAWGGQLAASLETTAWDARLSLGTQRTLGRYQDLAAVTALQARRPASFRRLEAIEPARARDWITVGLPLQRIDANFSFSLVNTDYDGFDDVVASATFSKTLSHDASLFVSGFADLGGGGLGVYGGMSLALGNRRSLSAGVSLDRHGASFTAEHIRTASSETGSYGWRASVSRGHTEQLAAGATYQGAKMRLEGQVRKFGQTSYGTAIIDGAVALVGTDLFLSKRIDDAFAVVDVGVGDVEVRFQNRPVGRTDNSGRILVPGLHSYQKNRIAINALDLPLDAEVLVTSQEVVPGERAGLRLDMRAKRHSSAAIIILRDAAGAFMPAGLEGRVVATGETFFIGYDGRAYVKELAPVNRIAVATGSGECTASFAFTPQPGSQPVVDDVICQ